MLSELARRGLQQTGTTGEGLRNGVPLMPRRPAGSGKITMARVNGLRDE